MAVDGIFEGWKKSKIMILSKLSKYKTDLNTAYKLMRALFFKTRIPFIVQMMLTYRCNHKCKYCQIWTKGCKELNTGQILSLIAQMARMGTRRIYFSGGEALLRDDIGLILEYCRQMGIGTILNSNGSLVPEKIKELRNLDVLCLSLDGPRQVHDSIRGLNSYNEVMDAIRSSGENNIKVKLKTVLSSMNLTHIDFILDKAKEFKTTVVFQPATLSVLGGNNPNPLAPLIKEYRSAIGALIKAKRTNKYIGNSYSALRYFYKWPAPTPIYCVSGLIVCHISPDGTLSGCGRRLFDGENNSANCLQVGFREAFLKSPRYSCKECWCSGYLELNCLASLRPDAVFNIISLA